MSGNTPMFELEPPWTLPSLPRIQPVQVAAPAEDSLVGGYQSVATPRGGDNDLVGGVAMNVGKQAGAGSYGAIDLNFNETLVDERTSLSIKVKVKVDLTFLNPHRHFPEADCRDRCLLLMQGMLQQTTGLNAQPLVSPFLPQENVAIGEHQKGSFPFSSGSSNHSAGMGETMSPWI